MTEIVKGKVVKVTKFEGGRYSYKLSDLNYYSGFGEPEFKEGANVEVEYKTNTGVDGKVYRNLVKVTRGDEQSTQQKIVMTAQEIEEKVVDLKLKITLAHQFAYDTAKVIIGRDPKGDEFSFVNSIVLNYLRGLYFMQNEN
jgi:hypothetical protein